MLLAKQDIKALSRSDLLDWLEVHNEKSFRADQILKWLYLRGADDFLQQLCEALGIQVGETTPDGLVTVEAVMCLAACDKAPMFQVQSGDGLTYHENMTVESTLELIEGWKAEGEAKEAE